LRLSAVPVINQSQFEGHQGHVDWISFDNSALCDFNDGFRLRDKTKEYRTFLCFTADI